MNRFTLLTPNIVAVFTAAMLWVSHADAVPVLIDDYDEPNPRALWLISGTDPDPFIHQAALTGTIAERDLKIDVIGTPNAMIKMVANVPQPTLDQTAS